MFFKCSRCDRRFWTRAGRADHMEFHYSMDRARAANKRAERITPLDPPYPYNDGMRMIPLAPVQPKVQGVTYKPTPTPDPIPLRRSEGHSHLWEGTPLVEAALAAAIDKMFEESDPVAPASVGGGSFAGGGATGSWEPDTTSSDSDSSSGGSDGDP